MESKKIVSMLAMAAALVGCSQDELATVNTQDASVDLSGRIVLEDVVLGVDAGSRMAIAEGSAISPVYEAGDQIGACLIDAPNYNKTLEGDIHQWTWTQYRDNTVQGSGYNARTFAQDGVSAKGFYELKEYISTNYPYTRHEDGKFYTNAELLEGNYMFYLPYAENHRIRERLNVVLPQIQDCSDEVMRETIVGDKTGVSTSSTALDQFFGGEMEGFEGAVSVVGYQFLDKNNTKPQVSMEPVFAYPLITIENNFNSFVYGETKNTDAVEPATATMVVDSIQIYYAGANANPLFYKAAVKSELIAGKMVSENNWWNDRFANNKVAYTAEILEANDAKYNHNGVYWALPKINAAIANDFEYVGKDHVTLVLGKELANGESYRFHAVLPAAEYGHDLKARVFATINGKACIISDIKNTVVTKKNEEDEDVVVGYACSGFSTMDKDYAFVDKAHGTQTLQLIRGEQYPKAEYIINNGKATGMKAFCGDMMTISLESTVAEDGTVTGATAFELVEKTEGGQQPGVDPADNGIADNVDFISFMNSYLQNGTLMTENNTLGETERSEWTAGQLAFAENHAVVINPELIYAIHSQVNLDNKDAVALTLTSAKLGIAADVKITNVNDDVYTFTGTYTDGESYSIKVQYKNVEFNGNGTNLLTGINKISTDMPSTASLKVKAGESNTVVYVSANAKFAQGSTGINAIYLTSGTLTVDAACDAMIIATGGEIVLTANGSLTNDKNTLHNVTITNNYEREIKFDSTSGCTVQATYTEWPATTIAANSMINKVIIAPAIPVEVLSIEQAEIDVFKNLNNVNVELNDKILSIKSASNVSLNKLSTLKSAISIDWNTSNTAGITITASGRVTLTNVNAGEGVNFDAQRILGDYRVTTSDKQGLSTALASGKDVKLSGNIDLGGSDWTPVGTESAPYTGTVDGNGYKITNLTISGTDNAALFAYTGENVTIKNITLENVNINSNKYAAGVVCNAGNNLKIENVQVSGTIQASSYASGIVFEASNIEIKNCVNNAKVSANRAAGIVSWISGSGSISDVKNTGEITGEIGASGIANRFVGTISNAVNNGKITAKGTEPASGIVCITTGLTTYEYCFNYGEVTSTADNPNASAAGILGQTPSKKATFNYCANYGNITAEQSYAAGIAYSLYGSIDAKYCYNNGKITGADGAGGIAPKAQYGAGDKASYCLNAGEVVSSNDNTYQGSNNNVSCYYYEGNDLKDVKEDTVVETNTALSALNGGADTGFFITSNGKIIVSNN